MKTYGVGIVGCGEVWGWHREAFDHLDCLRCVAVYDPNAERQAAAAAATGAREAASADEVLTAADVDIAAILTPVFTHADMVETATGAGKHLMLEKPMAIGLAEGQRIVDAISNAGVKCSIRRCGPWPPIFLRSWRRGPPMTGRLGLCVQLSTIWFGRRSHPRRG